MTSQHQTAGAYSLREYAEDNHLNPADLAFAISTDPRNPTPVGICPDPIVTKGGTFPNSMWPASYLDMVADLFDLVAEVA